MRAMGRAGNCPGSNLSRRVRGEQVSPCLIFVERLRRTVKYEKVYPNAYANPREARPRLTRYLAF